jgi:hypothetical protein
MRRVGWAEPAAPVHARSFRVLHEGRNSGRLPLASRALVKALPVRPMRPARPAHEMQPVYVWPSVVLPRPVFTVGAAEIQAAYALYRLKRNDDAHAPHDPLPYDPNYAHHAHHAHHAAAMAAGNR